MLIVKFRLAVLPKKIKFNFKIGYSIRLPSYLLFIRYKF